MKLKDSRSIRLALGLVGALTAAAMLMARPTHGGGAVKLSVPHDWSHRHVVFSGPSNIWHSWKLQQEPRFWHQWLHRNAESLRGANSLGPRVTNAVNASGGTSGIVINNVSSSSQASSLYFTYQSNSTSTISCNGTSGVGCAVKLTQSGLL